MNSGPGPSRDAGVGVAISPMRADSRLSVLFRAGVCKPMSSWVELLRREVLAEDAIDSLNENERYPESPNAKAIRKKLLSGT